MGGILVFGVLSSGTEKGKWEGDIRDTGLCLLRESPRAVRCVPNRKFPFQTKSPEYAIGHFHRKSVCFNLSVQCPGETAGQELTSSIVIIRVPWDSC